MVRSRQFWLKSTKIRSPRSSFHQLVVTWSGIRRSSAAAEADRGMPHVDEVPARLDPDVDVDAPVARRLREAGDAQLVEQRPRLVARADRRRRSRCPAAGRGRSAARRDGRRRRGGPATGGTTIVPICAAQAATAGSVGQTSSAVPARRERDLRPSRRTAARPWAPASGRTRRRRAPCAGGQLDPGVHALGPALQRGRPVPQRAEDRRRRRWRST